MKRKKVVSKKVGKKKPQQKVMKLMFANMGRRTMDTGDDVKVTSHGMYFGPPVAKKIGLHHKDYLLVAPDKSGTYIAKRPTNVFGGHYVAVAKSGRASVNNVSKHLKLKPGRFTLAAQPVSVSIVNEQGHEVFVNAYRLE